MNDLLKNILSELQVETLDEFDRNFVRKAFFDRPWPARRAPGGRGTLLAVTGRMRRSLRCSVGRSALSFFSDTAYFSLHNRGGTVPVTAEPFLLAITTRFGPPPGGGSRKAAWRQARPF